MTTTPDRASADSRQREEDALTKALTVALVQAKYHPKQLLPRKAGDFSYEWQIAVTARRLAENYFSVREKNLEHRRAKASGSSSSSSGEDAGEWWPEPAQAAPLG